MRIVNHIGESFEIKIQGNVQNSIGEKVDWWYRSCIIITEAGKKHKTHLKFLTREDINLLAIWIEKIYTGNLESKTFQFTDGHVWFKLWKKGKEPILRFFIQGDKYRRFYWGWRIKLDKEQKLLKYTDYLLNITKYTNN